MSGRGAAFFDLDRTLMSGSSAAQFGRAAYRAGLVSRSQMLRWGLDHVRFRLRGATDEDTEAVVAVASELLHGVSQRDLRRMVPDLLEGILPRIYPQMLAEVHSHQDAGRPAFIVSAASNGLVELLARVLDMEGGIGTRYEIDDDGRFTGRFTDGLNYGALKVEPIRRFADEHGIDLAESWAYSDAGSDLPMLELVGNPVAVNPDSQLATVAAERGWRVMRFETLGRKIAVAGVVTVATLVGAGVLAGRRVARNGAGPRR